MNNDEKIATVKEYIDYCNGTNEYHQYNQLHASALLTDGAKLVAEEFGAFWMIDVILSYQTTENRKKWRKHGYFTQLWELKKNKDDSATVTMSFNDFETEMKQEIPFTDFPMGKFLWKFNSYDLVICLPCED